MDIRPCSALQCLVLLLIALAVAGQCSPTSPTRRDSSTTASTTTTAPLLPSRNSALFASGATFTISSPEAFVTPEQQAALEDALPACLGLASGGDESEQAVASTKTTIKTSSTPSAACG